MITFVSDIARFGKNGAFWGRSYKSTKNLRFGQKRGTRNRLDEVEGDISGFLSTPWYESTSYRKENPFFSKSEP